VKDETSRSAGVERSDKGELLAQDIRSGMLREGQRMQGEGREDQVGKTRRRPNCQKRKTDLVSKEGEGLGDSVGASERQDDRRIGVGWGMDELGELGERLQDLVER
jgi:hypothetical protein